MTAGPRSQNVLTFMRILLVEDDNMIGHSLRQALTESDWIPAIASSVPILADRDSASGAVWIPRWSSPSEIEQTNCCSGMAA